MAKTFLSIPSDTRDPHFDRKMLAWTFQAQCQVHELVLRTQETIAATKLMIAEADRMIARR